MDTAATAPVGRVEPTAIAREISREIVSLQKRYFGRGPVHIRTHVLDDCVLVVMSGGHTQHERSLAEAGRSDLAERMRSAIHASLQPLYASVVEQRVGRPVIGFMSDSRSGPDLECQVYVLEANESVAIRHSANGSKPGI